MRGIYDLFVVFRLVGSLIRLVWRWSSGDWLNGVARTDAGWTEPATQVLVRQRVSKWWSWKPRIWRAGVRWGAFLGSWLLLCAFANWPKMTLLLLVAGVGFLGWKWWQRESVSRRRRAFAQQVVQPIYLAVREYLGIELYPMDRMTELLVVPGDYRDNPKMRVVLSLPSTFAGEGGSQTALTRIMQHKTGMELDAHWHMVGSPWVEWTRKPEPPTNVKAADIIPLIASCRDGEAILGLGTRGEKISIHLDTETPNIGMNMGVGGGKSSTLRGLIAQYRRQGAEFLICDVGRVSLKEFEGVPGVTIVKEVAEIWNAIDRLWQEMERRYAAWDKDPSVVSNFRRLFFTLEEGNDFYMQSLMYWEAIRDKSDSKVPPIFLKLGQLMVKARKIKIHGLFVYQNMDAITVGGKPQTGSLIRAQFGMKILARFTPQAWAFLVGTNPRPKSERLQGRSIIMVGDDMRKCQLAFWTPEEARAYALGSDEPASVTPEHNSPPQEENRVSVSDVSGRPSLTVIKGGGGVDTDSDDEESADPVTEADEDNDSAEDEEKYPMLYTLAEIAREQVIPMKAGTLRQAKYAATQRGAPFPVGKMVDGKLKYTAKEMRDWYADRIKASGS